MIHSSSTNESCSNSGIFFWFTIIFLNQSIVFLHAISILENEAGTNQGHALRYYHQQKKKKRKKQIVENGSKNIPWGVPTLTSAKLLWTLFIYTYCFRLVRKEINRLKLSFWIPQAIVLPIIRSWDMQSNAAKVH